MIERAMKRSGASAAKITTVKSAVALSVILAALILPQIVHAAAGASGGATWLPMYIPVILGGALLGPVWGLAVGISSPVVSFLITSALGSPMPVLTRLPYMIVELAVFAAVTGLFSKAILKNKALAFPAGACSFSPLSCSSPCRPYRLRRLWRRSSPVFTESYCRWSFSR